MTSHKHSHRIISRLAAVLGIVAVSAFVGISNPTNARAATVVSGSYSPTSSVWSFTDLVPNGASVSGTAVRTSATTDSVSFYARCSSSRGGTATGTQLIQTYASGGTTFTFSGTNVCTVSGATFVSGVEVRQSVAGTTAGLSNWSGPSATYSVGVRTTSLGASTGIDFSLLVSADPGLSCYVEKLDASSAWVQVAAWSCWQGYPAYGGPNWQANNTPPLSPTNQYRLRAGSTPSPTFGATSTSGSSSTPMGYNFTADTSGNSSTLPACILLDDQLAVLARTAGLAEGQIPTAVAIALAESRGNASAKNFNTNGSIDFGIWQINNAAHPEYATDPLLSNPNYNAAAMKAIYTTAGNWSPWSTYKSAAYGQFMSRGSTATSNTTGLTYTSPLGNTCPISGAASQGATDADNSSGDCGWTLNVLKVLKCVFIPQHSDDYVAKANTLVSTGAIGTLTNAFNYVSDTVTIYKHCSDAGTNDETCGGTLTLPGLQQTGSEGHPAKTLTNQTGGLLNANPYLGYFRQATGFIIIIGFGYYWWNRLTASLGSKGD